MHLQRFGGALNLNAHFHSLVIDGVYEVLSDSAGVRFADLPAPDLPEVARVLADAVERIRAALGRCAFDDDLDELARDNPALAALYAAAVEGRNATGAEAGRRTARVGREGLAVDPEVAVFFPMVRHVGRPDLSGRRNALASHCSPNRARVPQNLLDKVAPGRLASVSPRSREPEMPSFSDVRPFAFAVFALLLASCGGDGGTSAPPPRFVVALSGSAPFEFDETDVEDVCPYSLDFSVFLEDGGTGWVSLEHEAFGSWLFDVTWTGSGDRYEIGTGGLVEYVLFQGDPSFSADVGWNDLEITARDEDGDGTAETGTATVSLVCYWELSLSLKTERFDSSFDVSGDPAPSLLGFDFKDATEPLRPFADTVWVHAFRPLLVESIASDTRLLVNGEPFDATITPLRPVGPFAQGLVVDPSWPLPFGAELEIEAGSIVDGFGDAMEFNGYPYRLMADPGQITDNPSFEGTGGWIGLRTSSGTYELEPVEGGRVARVSSLTLVGYLDVPVDASNFSVAVAIEEYEEGCDHAGSRFVLATSKGSHDLRPRPSAHGECDWPEGCTVPWRRMSVDLTEVRGERVILRATPSRYTTCRPDYEDTLYIDDVRVE